MTPDRPFISRPLNYLNLLFTNPNRAASCASLWSNGREYNLALIRRAEHRIQRGTSPYPDDRLKAA